jgi:hypothetical protein
MRNIGAAWLGPIILIGGAPMTAGIGLIATF